MPQFSVVVPLTARNCKLLPYAPVLLDDTISVRSLKSEHIGAILKSKPSLAASLSSNTKCILWESGTSQPTDGQVKTLGLTGTFILNLFASQGAAHCGAAYVIKQVRSHSVESAIELDVGAHPNNAKYAIDKSILPAAIKTAYTSTIVAIGKDSSLPISMRRFNAAASKAFVDDRVIDMAICLESLFSTETEITFRFSLYNCLISELDPSKRVALFSQLKNFYKNRSKLVHGSQPDYNWINLNWDSILKKAKLALLAKIDFLQTGTGADWQSHLDARALGAA